MSIVDGMQATDTTMIFSEQVNLGDSKTQSPEPAAVTEVLKSRTMQRTSRPIAQPLQGI